jgi:hypothetical protein
MRVDVCRNEVIFCWTGVFVCVGVKVEREAFCGAFSRGLLYEWKRVSL